MASEKTIKSPVAVVMGSDSDLDVMQSCIDMLRDFGIQPVVRIISAHRTPKVASQFAGSAAKNGIKVIIAAAGMAAHLAGAIAAQTTLPVIGVPLAATENVARAPAATVWSAGWLVIRGAPESATTLSVAGTLVTEPTELLTTTA